VGPVPIGWNPNPRASVTDPTWIRRALADYERPLVRYASRLVGDPDRARDVVQETFLRLCSEPRRKVEPHLGRWLFTVCRNRALDAGEKDRRMTPMTEPETGRESDREDPALSAERGDTNARVLRELERLPENQREVLRLKFQSGFAYREIAEVTGLSVGNIGFLIHVGLKTLRGRLAPLSVDALRTQEVQS
jgi:RNA polymerase sigma-70 factor (ECF subfamily)